MTLLLIGLFLFLGTHALSRFTSVRNGLEDRLGKLSFKGLYSLLVLTGFVAIIFGYGAYRSSGYIEVWTPPAFLKPVSYVLMLPVFVLLTAAYIPGKIKSTLVHPMLAAVKLLALAHLLANGDLGSMLLFGGLLIWALFVRISLGKAIRVPTKWGVGDTFSLIFGLCGWVIMFLWAHPILIGVSVY